VKRSGGGVGELAGTGSAPVCRTRDPVRPRRVRILWARICGLVVLFMAGIAIGGPLLAAAGADVDGEPETTDLTAGEAIDWQEIALETQAKLDRSRARERRATVLARRRGRVIRRLQAAIRAHVEGPARAGLRCIHLGEGGWSANTGNGYFGGLQMDHSFMASYGAPLLRALGTADRWPPAAQLAVGEVAYYAGRGFGPWPTTRRRCGL
jgi:Transglycosylase-like domain